MNQFIYKAEDLNQLRNELKAVKNIKEVKIVTAFISNSNEVKKTIEQISRNKTLLKENFEIFLSPEFVPNNKVEELKYLMQLANIYIIDNLHAKAYYINGETELFAFGSSNLTDNGFGKNLELMHLEKNIDKNQVNDFFEYCKLNSKLIDEKLLKKYEEIDNLTIMIDKNDEVKKLKMKLKELKETLKLNNKNLKYNYSDLTDYFFNEEHYETFNNENAKQDNQKINNRRIAVREKLLEINSDIIKGITEKFDLYNHYLKEHIYAPSPTRPIPMNENKVDWLAIRYGRSPSFIKSLKEPGDTTFSFHKYTCFQINLSYENNTPFFEIGVFHSVPKTAHDRDKFIERLQNRADFNDKLIKILNDLKSNHLIFESYNKTNNKNYAFNIDTENAENFKNWYLCNVKEECYSSIMFKFEPNDIKIKSKENIEKLIFEKFKILKALYNLMTDWNA